MPLTPYRNRKPDAYHVIPKIPRYHAFHATDVLLASIYATDGTWLNDQSAIPLPPDLPTAENGTLIQVSPSPGGRVGDGRGGQGVRSRAQALAWRTGPNEITVWNLSTGQLHTYQTTATTPHTAIYCSPPVFHAGRLYWIEFPAHEDEPDTNRAPLILRHAAPDLTDPQTLATTTFAAGPQSWDLGPAAKVAATPDTLLFQTLWRDNLNGEVGGAAGASFLFSTHAAAAQEGARLDLAQGFAAIDGTALGLAVPSNTLRSMPSTLGAPTTPRWPATGPWSFAEGHGQAFNAAVSADGTMALLYGYSPSGDTPVVLEAPSTAIAGDPTARVSVASHPFNGTLPLLLFFLEP